MVGSWTQFAVWHCMLFASDRQVGGEVGIIIITSKDDSIALTFLSRRLCVALKSRDLSSRMSEMSLTKCSIESTRGEEGRSEGDMSFSRASVMISMVLSRHVVAARRSERAASKMVDNLDVSWSIVSVEKCCGWMISLDSEEDVVLLR